MLSLLFWFWVWSSSHCILRDNCLHYKGGWGGGDNPNKACFGRRTQFFQKFGNFIRNQETMEIFWETWYISRTWWKKIGTPSTIFLKSGKKSARHFKFAGWFSVSQCCAQTAFARTVTLHTTATSTDRWVELVHFAFPMDITWYLSEEFHLRHKFAYEHIEQKENSLENIIRSQLGTQNIEFKKYIISSKKLSKILVLSLPTKTRELAGAAYRRNDSIFYSHTPQLNYWSFWKCGKPEIGIKHNNFFSWVSQLHQVICLVFYAPQI